MSHAEETKVFSATHFLSIKCKTVLCQAKWHVAIRVIFYWCIWESQLLLCRKFELIPSP